MHDLCMNNTKNTPSPQFKMLICSCRRQAWGQRRKKGMDGVPPLFLFPPTKLHLYLLLHTYRKQCRIVTTTYHQVFKKILTGSVVSSKPNDVNVCQCHLNKFPEAGTHFSKPASNPTQLSTFKLNSNSASKGFGTGMKTFLYNPNNATCKLNWSCSVYELSAQLAISLQ